MQKTKLAYLLWIWLIRYVLNLYFSLNLAIYLPWLESVWIFLLRKNGLTWFCQINHPKDIGLTQFSQHKSGFTQD